MAFSSDVQIIIATSVTVGGAVAAVMRMALSGVGTAIETVLAKRVTPELIKMGLEQQALTRQLQEFREAKELERSEMRRILEDLHRIVQNHETRITVIERQGAA